MLARLYIDNYKCFSNFELTFGPLQLLLGDNGTGKSSVLDAVAGLQSLLSGDLVAESGLGRTLPRAGRGAGEQWVRESYPQWVAAQRRRANHTSTSLIAVVDADTLSVDQRRLQLDATMARTGLSPRDAKERSAIPRRNIETWVHFAETREIDETTDFKPRYRETKACRNAADVALQVCRSPDQSQAPPSLIAACLELGRILQS